MTGAPAWLVEVSPGETRAALVDGRGRLLELQVERMGRRNIVGALRLGRVTRVEKGIGAAFVEFGDDQPGFLGKAKTVTEGQAVIVQAVRAAGGGKGAVLTATPKLQGALLTLEPTRPGIHWPPGWPGDRAALAGLLEEIAPPGTGLTPSLRAADAPEAALRAEADYLAGRWRAVEAAAQNAKPPAELMPAPDLLLRVLLAADGPVTIDDPRRLAALRDDAPPGLAQRVTVHREQAPLFEAAGIEEQIEAALEPHVAMPGGAGLVIETTEALTAIDVNMGGSGGRLPSDAAVRQANEAAAREAARQIRLRNIAGLIVIDFISMRNKTHRRQLVEALRRAMRDDPVRHDVLGMTPAGLVEVTRQRTGEALGALFLAPARREARPLAEAQACAAMREALRRPWTGRPVLEASPAIVAALEGPLAPALAAVRNRLGGALELAPRDGAEGYEFGSERGKAG